MNKFIDFSNFSKLYEENEGDVEATLRAAAEQYIRDKGNDKHLEDKVDLVIKSASSVAHMEDPSTKIKKALRELNFDSKLMDEVRDATVKYLVPGGGKASGFDVFWSTLKDLLLKLAESDNSSYQTIVSGILNRSVELDLSEGIEAGKMDIFEAIRSQLKVSGSRVDNFLKDVYNLNVKIGNNPSGKGEYLLILFVKDSVKSSDVKIGDTEYEIKTTNNAAIGESLGSKLTYISELRDIFERGNTTLDYEKFTFGKVDFSKKWAPIFVAFTVSNPELGLEFLKYQYKFFMQEKPEDDLTFMELISNFKDSEGVEKLAEIYDHLVRVYVKKALPSHKSMLIFEEKKSGPSGKFTVFEHDAIDDAVSFSGSNTKSVVKIVLPKSSATMRPEIGSINNLEETEE